MSQGSASKEAYCKDANSVSQRDTQNFIKSFFTLSVAPRAGLEPATLLMTIVTEDSVR